jgi:hypothetical protein
MRARITGYVAIAAFVTTVLWLILLITSQVAAGPLAGGVLYLLASPLLAANLLRLPRGVE